MTKSSQDKGRSVRLWSIVLCVLAAGILAYFNKKDGPTNWTDNWKEKHVYKYAIQQSEMNIPDSGIRNFYKHSIRNNGDTLFLATVCGNFYNGGEKSFCIQIESKYNPAENVFTNSERLWKVDDGWKK